VSDPLAPIANKIRPLIRLLSSDQSGEVVAAARALSRLLKTNGADIHVLADSIGQANGGLSEKEMRKLYDAGFEAGLRKAESAHGDPGFRYVNAYDEPNWHDIACECAKHDKRLHSEREREFVRDMVRRSVHGGKLTEKQAAWLRSIYARVRRRTA
jgi:hypothetical protein